MTETWNIADTTPAAASTVVGSVISGLAKFKGLRIEAQVVGATGGALDIYLQRKIGPNLWADWVHFAQLAAGASALLYSLAAEHVNATAGALTAVTSGGTDASPVLSLAANNFNAGHPGDYLRAVYVAGASTSAGAAIKFYVTGIGPSR